MRELIFLLEEESAKSFLESVLPRILDQSINARLIAFEGKQDLEKQLSRKIRGYANPNARFIVMRDQDSNPDCIAIKNNLITMCQTAGKAQQSLIRIACKELETFYLADLAAVGIALKLNNLHKLQEKANYRTPDNLPSPKNELKKLTKNNYQNVSSSKEIGKVIDINNHRSKSFKNLIGGIKKLESQLLQINCS